MSSQPDKDIYSLINSDLDIGFSIEGLSKGIDNYHIDIRLSRRFASDVKKVVALLVPQIAVPTPKPWDNSRNLERLRNSYLDLMTVLIHRVKTDLSADHISFLQLAALKHIIRSTSAYFDSDIRQLSAKLSELRNKGSSDALATDQKLFWLKKNRDLLIYRVNKQLFAQLGRVEERQLKPIRDQFLGPEYDFVSELILNPLLSSPDINNLSLLTDEYKIWDLSGDEASFMDIDSKVTKLFDKRISALPSLAIKPTNTKPDHPEIHDEMSGFFKIRNLLGPSEDAKSELNESFDWLEHEDNISILFNSSKTDTWLKAVKKEHGFFAWWKCRKDVKHLKNALSAFIKLLRKEKLVPQLLAETALKKAMNPLILERTELKTICQFIVGKLAIEKVQESIVGNNKLSNEQVRVLEQLQQKVAAAAKSFDESDAISILTSLGRYRRNLKLYRMAHRAFNRMVLLTDDDEIRLSKSAGTLNLLPVSSEVEEADAKICHHAVLKADVRGSTTVTDELMKKGLNPASYFSMRFFNPINKILETYGANKVFIEGDAIILSFLEYEHAPEQWFSVSRACGYAKDMLKITNSNNRYSDQMGLPLLELGVGICYSKEAPRYLYDEDHPIMISGAIGLADRMSGCSWNLRAAIKTSLFNIDVLRIADGETSKGEKGQQYVRYNVNGINIDDQAFHKLKNEISLKTVELNLEGTDYLFHVGQYPDMNGRKKDLVIREGKVGIWSNGQILPDDESIETYFEVVVNRKVIPQIVESINASQTLTVS